MYAVGDLESALLAQALDAAYQFACNALQAQVLADFQIERNGQSALVGHAPSGNILAEDLYVGQFYVGCIAAGQCEEDAAVVLQLAYLLLCHGLYGGIHVLHQCAELLSHDSEVALHLLYQHAFGLHKLHLLDVHFVQDELLHCFESLSLLRIGGRDSHLLQRLFHYDLLLLTQAQYHGGQLLGQSHALLLLGIDDGVVSLGECAQVYTLLLFLVAALGGTCEVSPQTVGIEWGDGRHQLGDGLQAGVEGLVGAQLVGAHGIAPEALLAQAHKPVAHLIYGKCLDEASCLGGLIVLIALLHVLDE